MRFSSIIARGIIIIAFIGILAFKNFLDNNKADMSPHVYSVLHKLDYLFVILLIILFLVGVSIFG